jgi:predicted  nucleic acid-binding Zn-ribbon protein
MLSQISARWGGRAQKQDTDGRVLERTADATQRAEVVDATMGSALKTLTDAVTKMDKTVEGLASKLGAHDVLVAEVRVKADADRGLLTRLETEVAALRGEMRRADEAQTNARHDLRDSIHGMHPIADLAAAITAQSAATVRAADAAAQSAEAARDVARMLSEREVPRASRPRGRG